MSFNQGHNSMLAQKFEQLDAQYKARQADLERSLQGLPADVQFQIRATDPLSVALQQEWQAALQAHTARPQFGSGQNGGVPFDGRNNATNPQMTPQPFPLGGNQGFGQLGQDNGIFQPGGNSGVPFQPMNHEQFTNGFPMGMQPQQQRQPGTDLDLIRRGREEARRRFHEHRVRLGQVGTGQPLHLSPQGVEPEFIAKAIHKFQLKQQQQQRFSGQGGFFGQGGLPGGGGLGNGL